MSKSMVTRTGLCIAALNALFVLLGLAGLVFSVIFIFDPQLLKRVLGQVDMCHLNLQEASWVINKSIWVSSVLCFFLSAAGCLAALFLLRKILVFYALSLLFILATEMSFITYLIMTDANSKTFIERGMERMLLHYNESRENPPEVYTEVKTFFGVFRCCGIQNATDFTSGRLYWTLDPSLRPAHYSLLIPMACCRNTSSDVNTVNPSRNATIAPIIMPPNESNVSVSANATLNATSLRSGASHSQEDDRLKRLQNIQRAYSDCLTNANATNSFSEGCMHAVDTVLREHSDKLILFAVILGCLLILLLCLTMSHCLSENLETALEQTHVRKLPQRTLGLGLAASDSPLSDSPESAFEELMAVSSIRGFSRSDRGDVIVTKARTMSDITVEEAEHSSTISRPSSSRYDQSQSAGDLQTLFGQYDDASFKMARLQRQHDSAKSAGKRHWLLALMKETDSSIMTSMSDVRDARGSEPSASRLLLREGSRGYGASQRSVQGSQSAKRKITASSSLIKSYQRQPDQADSPEDTSDASSSVGRSSIGEEKPAREEEDSFKSL